jgi:AcrR family transcriptional regulator
MRASTEESRAAIQRTALATFCARGYRTTTLEEIGAQVGVTRGTVLHHFKSKADLLAAVADPYLKAVEVLLDSAEAGDPPTVAEQRQLLTDLADLLLQHRDALRLLVTDVAARVQLGLVDQWAAPTDRLVRLLLGSYPAVTCQVRVSAALGAMIHPLASGGVRLNTAESRSELIDAALAVLARPNTPGTSPADPAAHRLSRGATPLTQTGPR